MAIEVLIFDLDDTICKTGYIHLAALNQALAYYDAQYCISEEENISIGTKPTKNKLEDLTKLKGLPKELYNNILLLKREKTLDILDQINPDTYFNFCLLDVFNQLKKTYKLYLASNTNEEFINIILQKIGLTSIFDKIYCNSNTEHTKPNPQMFLKAMVDAGASPDQCLIFEDSIRGQEAAVRSGAHVFGISHPDDLTLENINTKIRACQKRPIKWQSKMTVIIPMAGEGSRFQEAGFQIPKPLIPVNGLPMVGRVLKDLNLDANYVFIIKEEHQALYDIETMLKLLVPTCSIVKVQGKQQGAATTILAAKHLINHNPLLIVNSDNVWDWNEKLFYYKCQQNEYDGLIGVFHEPTRDKRWSFARTNNKNNVIEVAEKQPISDLATSGIYFFNKGTEFIHYAEQMISKNIRVNNEFYLAPVYNEYIADNKKIGTFLIDKFWGMGTPEELAYYKEKRIESL